MIRKAKQITTLALALMMGAACATTAPQPTATVTSSGGPSIGQARAEAYNGPKARIAVNKFVNKAALGGHKIGSGMSDMLTTALFSSNRFIVLDRQDHADVMAEQDLGASGRVSQQTAAPIGQMEGAELLVTGAVTEFDPRASGGFGGVGVPLGVGGLGVGGATQNAHIAIDVKVVDTRTGRIVAAATVQGRATDQVGGIGAFLGPLALGLGGYQNTPMEKAIRVCIQKSVEYIVSQTPADYYH